VQKRSPTRVDFCPLFALLARHLAAPVEFTVTLPEPCVLLCAVTSTATYVLAPPVYTAGTVTRPPAGPQRPYGRVELAVVGRLVQIDEISSAGLFVGPFRATQLEKYWFHRPLATDWFNVAGGASVAECQLIADHAEPWQRLPAGLQCARPRYTVAPAFSTNQCLSDL